MPTETSDLQIFALRAIGEITPGDHLAAVIATACEDDGRPLCDGDVVVVTQKIVSKAEGRLVPITDDLAAKIELVETESVRILRRRGELLITETTHGFVCANAGVDLSNVAKGWAALLPLDPDLSARRIRAGLQHLLGVDVGVVVSDTFGRAWRNGVVDVAIGCAGIAAVVDLRGTFDAHGRELVATEICLADEIASAAELVMGKNDGVPVAIVRGLSKEWFRASSVKDEIVRRPEDDLFR